MPVIESNECITDARLDSGSDCECDRNYHEDWEAPPYCYWLAHPDSEYMLFTGPSYSAYQVGSVLLARGNKWEAYYTGWETQNLQLSRGYGLAEEAALAVVDAIKEGPNSRCWNKSDCEWCEYRHDKLDYPTAYFRWQEGITYEAKLGHDGKWYALRDGSAAIETRFVGEDDQAREFNSAEGAMKYLNTTL